MFLVIFGCYGILNTNVNYANDNRTVIIGVELLPGKEYGITLLGLSFRTPEGDAIKPYEISFKTAE